MGLLSHHSVLHDKPVPFGKSRGVSAGRETAFRNLLTTGSTVSNDQPRPLTSVGRVATTQNSADNLGARQISWFREISLATASIAAKCCAESGSAVRSRTLVSTRYLAISRKVLAVKELERNVRGRRPGHIRPSLRNSSARLAGSIFFHSGSGPIGRTQDDEIIIDIKHVFVCGFSVGQRTRPAHATRRRRHVSTIDMIVPFRENTA